MSEMTQKKPLWKRWWVWAVAIVILGGLSRMGCNAPGGTGTASGAAQPSQTPDVVVSASTYFDDYQANEVAADQQYKGKLIEITGVVDAVRSTMGSQYIDLETSNQLLDVACKMSGNDGLAAITKGQKITIIGTGAGKFISPQVEDCTIKP